MEPELFSAIQERAKKQVYIAVPLCPDMVEDVMMKLKQFIAQKKMGPKEISDLKILRDRQLRRQIVLKCSRKAARILIHAPGVRELRICKSNSII